MGIRYYAWPLRNELDWHAAIRDPLSCSYSIDARESAAEDRLARAAGRPTVGEPGWVLQREDDDTNCLGLDKAWRTLQEYFDRMPEIDDDEFGPIPARVLPRPGLLLLDGNVTWHGYEHVGFYGVAPAPYVRAAADDYDSVDLDELERTCEQLNDGDGEYCRSWFEPFRAAIRRWADEGLGCLYAIT